MKRKSDNAIVDAENALEAERDRLCRRRRRDGHRYLRSHGWTYTSDTPGCHWLWRKATPKGETLLVGTELAIAIQRGSCAIRGNEW